MSLFVNNWINVDIKKAAKDVIVRQRPESIVHQVPEPINKQLSIIIGRLHAKIEQPTIPAQKPTNKHLKSAYFRDMVSIDKHSKASYSKDLITGKHKKSSYVKEFVHDK